MHTQIYMCELESPRINFLCIHFQIASKWHYQPNDSLLQPNNSLLQPNDPLLQLRRYKRLPYSYLVTLNHCGKALNGSPLTEER